MGFIRVAGGGVVGAGADLTGLLDYKGATDCSGNPNYPSASKGDVYLVSVAGKIGGASGTTVEAADMYVCLADNGGGTQASVGTSWSVVQSNLVGALLSANNLSDVGSTTTARSNLGLAIGSNVQAYNANLAALAGLTFTGYKVFQLNNGTLELTALTASRAIVTNSSGNLVQSSVTSTELGYLSGVTSAVQTQLDARILKNIGTTKGDIITYSASNTPVRLGVGTNGYVLTAASGAAGGVTWAAAGGGGLSADYAFTYEAGTGAPSSGCFRYGSNTLYFSKTDANGKTVTTNGLGYRLLPNGGILAIHSTTLDVALYGVSDSSVSDQSTHFRITSVTLNVNSLVAAPRLTYSPQERSRYSHRYDK